MGPRGALLTPAPPFLRFDFPDGQTDGPLCFTDPMGVIRAERIEDVLPALARLEAAVSDGCYAAGYLAYEAAPAFDDALRVQPNPGIPLLWFGIFREPSPCPPSPEEQYTVSEWRPDVDEVAYHHAIAAIREAIAAGETYQLNYTMRLRAAFAGSAERFYDDLRQAQGRGYHAYLNLGRFRILSVSPELFFQWSNGRIETRPMKGTAPRGRWPAEDAALAEALRNSEKDRAENVMIVDMVRNDLGRIAMPGSVHVENLFEVETYPTVHQMTSTISAQTQPRTRLTDVFRALFPCGSVTGAPKVQTMGLIAGLEHSPRGVYCGAIGYVRPGGEAVFNVPIRTLLLDTETGTAEYGVGGGITWDSTAENEYAETLWKSRVLTERDPPLHLLETLRLENGEYFLLDRHLQRLEESARYFGFSVSRDSVQQALEMLATGPDGAAMRIRLTVSAGGVPSVIGEPLTASSGPATFVLAGKPVSTVYRFLYHKTTNRRIYEEAFAGHEGVYDVLLWNERGEVTEFTKGNVVLEIEDERWTPPVESGLLPGTFRAELLERGEVMERVLVKADLKRAARVWFINSVRGWVELQPADGAT